MYRKKTKEEEAAYEKYRTYVRGWKDGCAGRAFLMDRNSKEALNQLYHEAYLDGVKAVNEMAGVQSKRFGHDPKLDILR